MRAFTIRSNEAFLQALKQQNSTPVFTPNTIPRSLPIELLGLSALPLMPWVTPPIPEPLMGEMHRLGSRRMIEAGEYVFPAEMPFDHLVVLLSGIGGRAFGSLLNQNANALALAIPGRIFGGNHCFFSEHPGVGRYMAITPVEALYVSKLKLKQALRSSTALFELTAAHLDLCFQSDRLGFGAIALLPVRERLLLWCLSWGFVYGRLVFRSDGEWLRLEPMLPVELLARVVSSTPSQVKRDLASLRSSGIWCRDDDALWIRTDALDKPWVWLCHSEEWTAVLKRPSDWRTFFDG